VGQTSSAEPQASHGIRPGFRADLSRILKYAPAQLIGRDDVLSVLSVAWEKVCHTTAPRPHVLTFVALGGEGKTSLVAKWAVELAAQDWPGCDAAFAWSFYSQGTREQLAASSDLFLKAALTFFGDEADKAFAASPAGAFEKGQRLARLVGQRRSLLILDGLEPLQYAPTAPTAGQLKDQGLAALLKGLAAASHGLCLVTTRYSLPDLRAFWQTTAPEVKLLRLSRDAGVLMLKTLGVRGTAQEFETLVEDVKGHALTLTLLGGFLKRAFHGDIRQRDRVKFEKADEKMDGGHAFRTMAAYEQWLLRDGGDEGRREVAVLRLMGLFDRPADAGCLAALRSETIPDLTEPLAGLADDDWEFCLTGLETAKLLTVNRDVSGAVVSLDAHPHLREYSARQLRTQKPDAWRAAHRRLYEHLCATTPDKPQPTLEDLQPLYQAVAHGCQAGKEMEAWTDIYRARILRPPEYYSRFQLGAFASDYEIGRQFLAARWALHTRIGGAFSFIRGGSRFGRKRTNFFERSVGSLIAPCLMLFTRKGRRAWRGVGIHASLLNDVSVCLMAMGRLDEGEEVMRQELQLHATPGSFQNLTFLLIGSGKLQAAIETASAGVALAEQNGDQTEAFATLHVLGLAYEHAGQGAKPVELQGRLRHLIKRQIDFDTFVSWATLTGPERAAWRRILGTTGDFTKAIQSLANSKQIFEDYYAKRLPDSPGSGVRLKDHAEGQLVRSRIGFYEHLLTSGITTATPPFVLEYVEDSIRGFRNAQVLLDLPRSLLTRAWLRFLTGALTGPESAQADLDEAWEIAERGPMRLFMADIHLTRARLFGVRNEETKYPWESPAADLAAAEQLIHACGYHRRDEELADAKRAILDPSPPSA
jgi:hypothetical protein